MAATHKPPLKISTSMLVFFFYLRPSLTRYMFLLLYSYRVEREPQGSWTVRSRRSEPRLVEVWSTSYRPRVGSGATLDQVKKRHLFQRSVRCPLHPLKTSTSMLVFFFLFKNRLAPAFNLICVLGSLRQAQGLRLGSGNHSHHCSSSMSV